MYKYVDTNRTDNLNYVSFGILYPLSLLLGLYAPGGSLAHTGTVLVASLSVLFTFLAVLAAS